MTYEEIAKEMITQFFNVTGIKERWKSWGVRERGLNLPSLLKPSLA